MSALTTHVLDTATGLPARGVPLRVERLSEGSWRHIAAARTDDDGRAANLVPPGDLPAGTWRLTFETGEWFRSQDRATFWPYVQIVFENPAPATHYHVPLLLSPYGYTTYRGS